MGQASWDKNQKSNGNQIMVELSLRGSTKALTIPPPISLPCDTFTYNSVRPPALQYFWPRTKRGSVQYFALIPPSPPPLSLLLLIICRPIRASCFKQMQPRWCRTTQIRKKPPSPPLCLSDFREHRSLYFDRFRTCALNEVSNWHAGWQSAVCWGVGLFHSGVVGG